MVLCHLIITKLSCVQEIMVHVEKEDIIDNSINRTTILPAKTASDVMFVYNRLNLIHQLQTAYDELFHIFH